jgi:glutamate racemase
MINQRLTLVGVSLAFLMALSAGRNTYSGQERSKSGFDLERFFQKRGVRIAVTDSGLGGLSVVAEAVRRMKEAGEFERVDFIFYNALFSVEGGYNSLKTREEKIGVFDSALGSLDEKFRPDLILIGCNTLSVLYKDTLFSKKTRTPVIGIVEPGVELIAENLRSKPGSMAVIFGTPTTIAEKSHKAGLSALGISPSRIVEVACPELEMYIERDFAGDDTEMIIAGCVDEAVAKLPKPASPFYASLNCTHFGYSMPLWEKAFREAGVRPEAILNPNSRLAAVLFEPRYLGRYPKTQIAVRVVSMVEIDHRQIQSLGKWLAAVSPETAEALGSYELNPSLFEWKENRKN